MSDQQKPNFDSLPALLKASCRWVLWRLEDDGERKRSKVPYQAKHPGQKASPTDPAAWATYEEAVRALPKLRAAPQYKHEPNCKGIGLVIGPPFLGADLDKVRNPETGERLNRGLRNSLAI
jgi:primase-polymerase (primpol)-like protein